MKEININCDFVIWPDGRRMAKGVKSIAELFDVSYVTASRYKRTILKPAIVERGKMTFVDIDKAVEIYSQSENSNNEINI